MTKLNFVSDRGANFLKALKPYSTTNCVAHRSNNVVKVGFYQTVKKKSKNNKIVPSQTVETISFSDSENDTDNDDEEDDDDECNGGEDVERDEENKNNKGGGKKDQHVHGSKGVGCATTSCILDYSKIKLPDIPPAALHILKTIGSCKSLVRYVKKVRNTHLIKIIIFN